MIKDTYVKVDKNAFHFMAKKSGIIYYICAWYIQNFSSLQSCTSRGFSELYSTGEKPYAPIFGIHPDPKGIKIEIVTQFTIYRWNISISTPSGKVPLKLSNHIVPHRIYRASIEGEDFQKLKQLPDSTYIIICRLKQASGETVLKINSEINSSYLYSLKADLKKYPGTSLKEIVNLHVGEETECVSKTLLCMKSPVFARMFENDMKELKDNTVTITDIKMSVLRVLVSFLYSGLVPDSDFDFLCHLYYAADKYDISDLQLVCITLLVSKVSLENLLQLLKLSLVHNDELLKSVAMTLINANKEAITLTPDWKHFMHEDPLTALEAVTFFSANFWGITPLKNC